MSNHTALYCHLVSIYKHKKPSSELESANRGGGHFKWKFVNVNVGESFSLGSIEYSNLFCIYKLPSFSRQSDIRAGRQAGKRAALGRLLCKQLEQVRHRLPERELRKKVEVEKARRSSNSQC